MLCPSQTYWHIFWQEQGTTMDGWAGRHGGGEQKKAGGNEQVHRLARRPMLCAVGGRICCARLVLRESVGVRLFPFSFLVGGAEGGGVRASFFFFSPRPRPLWCLGKLRGKTVRGGHGCSPPGLVCQLAFRSVGSYPKHRHIYAWFLRQKDLVGSRPGTGGERKWQI